MNDEIELKQGDVSAIITRTNKRNRDDGGGGGCWFSDKPFISVIN